MLDLRRRAQPRSRLPKAPAGLGLDGGEHGGSVGRAGTLGAADRGEPRASAAVVGSDFAIFANSHVANFRVSSRSIVHDRPIVRIAIVRTIASVFDSS
ncbi:MAG: hypothetical protein ABR929_03385 [Roseiarcus sp.]